MSKVRATEAIRKKRHRWSRHPSGARTADTNGCLMIEVNPVRTYGPARRRVYALHRSTLTLYGPLSLTAGKLGRLKVHEVLEMDRPNLIEVLSEDTDGLMFIRGERPQDTQEDDVPKKSKDKAWLPVVETKRKVIEEVSHELPIPRGRLMLLLRSLGAEVPDEAEVRIDWGDRDPAPLLSEGDRLLVCWSTLKER